MSTEEKRTFVRDYLNGHADVCFRQAVYALQLLYNPAHLDLLFGMALRRAY
ncbi:hypothetical protein [Magnetospirillum aberrantis]|uniref:Uncharacterized protein n=1 Tax=Magnetospirillum aberrantis SpK TaxID=908842 RepID=A0A7C9QY27_9PROT|nr:hypothetical protein [Magnetospirillum aberrantis]NFV82116.1 hypothetical protein [Magnetospirillum aberrantis SpK]